MLEQEQQKLLEETLEVVREQGAFIRLALQKENLRLALKHASNMIGELRTSLLSPKSYYELCTNIHELVRWLMVFQDLQHLLAFFSDKSRHGRKYSDLYETVQHAGNILPRLYLLITVGVAYVKSKEAPAADILRDMTELCKGVQHPTRGLFLRFYLTQMCRDILPDVGTPYEQEGGGTFRDAFLFLLTNFTESTRLWTRLQHQGGVRDRAKSEKERQDLRVLVGSMLVRMAALEGMNAEFYRREALPSILEHIVGCKDSMAQQYLLDCVIQVFSDECHLQTLDLLLDACKAVQANEHEMVRFCMRAVSLKPVLVNLLRRLSSFLQAEPEALPEGVDVFCTFRGFVDSLVENYLNDQASSLHKNEGNTSQSSLELASLLQLLEAFLTFSLALYPDRVDYVEALLGSVFRLLIAAYPQQPLFHQQKEQRMLQQRTSPGAPSISLAKIRESRTWNEDIFNGCDISADGVDALKEIIASPFRTISMEALDLRKLASISQFLDVKSTREVSRMMVDAVLSRDGNINSAESFGNFLELISPLLLEDEGSRGVSGDSESDSSKQNYKDDDEINLGVEEQQRIAKLTHLFKNSDTDAQFNLILVTRSKLTAGVSLRLKYILPALVVEALKLGPKVLERQQKADARLDDVSAPSISFKKVFQFVHTSCLDLVAVDADVALRLMLAASAVVDEAQRQAGCFEAIIHEFLAQALVCYEEEINDSKRQFQVLIQMVGWLSEHIRGLEASNYASIASKITQHAAKLLKKPDQCRAILACSHLFWNNPEHRDRRRVLECLQKCLKIADVAVQASTSHVGLFVEILDKYVFFFDQGNEEITADFIQNLLALCTEHCKFAELGPDDPVVLHFKNIITHLKYKIEQEWNEGYRRLTLNNITL